MTDRFNVLLVGGGGREHAIANALVRSPRLGSLAVAPGNAGTAQHNVELNVDDHDAVVGWCRDNAVDLVVVGPEAPLVAGLADALAASDISCFGPSAAAAQLEGSKAFARRFAARHDIPGPRCESFTEVAAALEWLDEFDRPVVVKADGLASGKGVIIPESRVETERAIFDLLSDRTMGDAGATVVLEERLEGEELSLFGIADGETVVTVGTAQDHKRVGEGDTGLNTGGMGAFAPVPGTAELERELAATFLDAAVAGMAAEGMPYVGVLYAGVMLTDDGPRLIEYNCRFGDPEAQVLLPLIGSDVLELMAAAATGGLADAKVELVTGTTAATVVVAAKGYPTSPASDIVIPALSLDRDQADMVAERVEVIHAGTKLVDGQVLSSGGRVLSVTGTGPDLAAALSAAYSVVDEVTGKSGDFLFARSDIGHRYVDVSADGVRSLSANAASGPGRSGHHDGGAYAAAGVSFEAAADVNSRIADAVLSTHDERVVTGIGGFGGVFDLSSLKDLADPLLVASTDGVGTKTVLAEQLDSWESVGADIVNHGINDVLVQGARPLFFLDTVAAATLEPAIVGRVVSGMAEACRAASCVLLGGETAEMPDVLTHGAVDIAGTMVGAVDRSKLLPRAGIEPGHQLIGLASSGLHTNGYSLARKLMSGSDLAEPLPGGDGVTIGQALLEVHRSYLGPLAAVLDADLIGGLAHITGGGLVDNLPRVLPDGCGAVVDTTSWPRPPLFTHLVALAGLNMLEAHQVLNMGIGMVAIVAPGDVDEVQAMVDEPTWIIGRVTEGQGVTLQ
jgi:phosphoribosylamine--glycine ligase/phosphoribosylaminoimidazole synthetase